MKSAKAIRKLKHIRQVKYAIRYREQTQERLAPIKKQNKETKEYIVRSLNFAHRQTQNAREARKNAREDWNLGPLRPNRAIGPDAGKYGALAQEEMRGPEIPQHWYGAKESVQKRMKTKIPDHVFRDQWPIVVGDRVIITEGKDKNRVGVVDQLQKDLNSVIVKDLNKIWADGRLFNYQPGEKRQAKREWELSLPYEHVRLIMPYNVYKQDDRGRILQMRQDVIVEAIDVEKHTTGINPFTGEEEVGIPEDQQLDPETEEVAYHRYVAGTRIPIEWPWDTSAQKEKDGKESARAKGLVTHDKEPIVAKKEEAPRGLLDRVRNIIGRKPSPKSDNSETQAGEASSIPDETDPNAPKVASTRPREREPIVYEEDSQRNIVEGQITWIPSLVMPPFPETVFHEVQEARRERDELDKEAVDYEEQLKARKERHAEAKARKELAKQQRIDRMKTPLQIKWELEQAQKQKLDPREQPQVPRELLFAIGKHMEANRQQLRK